MHPHLPTMRALRGLAAGFPRVHPNGFIQLDLDAQHRLHVWHPALPYRQRTYHPVHNHVFDFTSHVYGGRLVNVDYLLHNMDEGHGSHIVWQVQMTEDEETVLRPKTGASVSLHPMGVGVIQPGGSYRIHAYQFHESLSNEPTLTIMRKSEVSVVLSEGPNSQGASVAVPVGVEPDNDFRRDAVDVDVLWKLIDEAHPGG